MFDFTELIKQKFELFQGKRDQSEDAKLLNAINSLVKKEVTTYIRTTVKNTYEVNKALEKSTQKESEEELESLLDQRDPEWRLALISRINAYLDNLKFRALEKTYINND
jgi:hypothetical protein